MDDDINLKTAFKYIGTGLLVMGVITLVGFAAVHCREVAWVVSGLVMFFAVSGTSFLIGAFVSDIIKEFGKGNANESDNKV